MLNIILTSQKKESDTCLEAAFVAESSMMVSTKSSDLAFSRPKTPQLLSVEATISRMTFFRCPGVKFPEEDANVEEEGVVSWNRRGFIN